MITNQSHENEIIQNLLDPYYQTDIRSFKAISELLDLKPGKESVMDIFHRIGLFPLDNDTLKQKRLMQMVSAFSSHGQKEIAREIVNRMKHDPNLGIDLADRVVEEGAV